MPRSCPFTKKKVMSGNKVSHAQNKTRRTFAINIQKVTFSSDLLACELSLRMPVSTIRTIEKNGGIDSYCLKLTNVNLDSKILKIKNRMIKKLSLLQNLNTISAA